MRSPSLVPKQGLILFTILVSFWMMCGSAPAQTVSTWSGGAGNWSDCPPSGNALWDTCPDPPKGKGWPNGNFDAVINGGPVNATSASIVNLTIGSGGSLVFQSGVPGILDITGTSITNNGSISLAGTDGLQIEGNTTVTLSGSGMVTMAGNNFTGGNGSPTLILRQTVQGQGSFSLGLSLANQSLINAVGGTLAMQPNSLTNTSTMEASSGGILAFTNGVATAYNNTGGTIKALNGGTVQMENGIYTGGTLTTVGTGVIQASASAVLNNLTNSGTLQVLSANDATLQNTITNIGTIQVPNSTLFMTGNVTLTGAGSVIMSGSSSLHPLNGAGDSLTITSPQLIHGSGTIFELPVTNQGNIDADSAGKTLFLAGSTTTNTSTLEASGGGILQIDNDNTVNNVGGVIQAMNGSTVNFAGTVKGGTLTTAGTGVIQGQNGTLDGTVNTPTNAGKINVKNFDLFLQGTVNNDGTIALTGNSCVILNQPSTLTGTGKLMLAPTTCIFGSGRAFTNQSTIMGAGSIGDSNPMPITNGNFGTIVASSKTPLIIQPDASGFTNTGKLVANPGSTLTINGLFNSLSGGTLMPGTYMVSGTLGLQNSVVTNDASITLTGSTAQLFNNNTATNALRTLTTNGSTGLLSVQKGQALTTGTNLSNAGKIIVGTSSQLTLGGSYTQTAGSTTVDGSLSAPTGLTLQAGTLVGSGTLVAAVISDASITAGDSTTKPAKLTVAGSYTQNSTGTLNISIGGTAAGKFGELAVSNGVSLGGTLSIKLVNGFVPTIGEDFTILTGSAVSGKFATVKGTSINSGEHFQVNYNAASVTLSVVSGP